MLLAQSNERRPVSGVYEIVSISQREVRVTRQTGDRGCDESCLPRDGWTPVAL